MAIIQLNKIKIINGNLISIAFYSEIINMTVVVVFTVLLMRNIK